MMFWLLYSLSISQLEITNSFLRLPVYCEQEGTHPYEIVTIFSPNIELTPKDPNIIKVEKLPSNPDITIANVSVLYSDATPVLTEIIIKHNEFLSRINVTVEKIDHLQIYSTATTFHTFTYVPIKVDAFNSEGLKFSSLNGTKFEWGQISDKLKVDLINPKNTKLHGTFDSTYVVIKSNDDGETNVTCKFPYRDAKMANQQFKIVTPITFYPNHLYLLKGTTVDLHLYQAFLDKEQQLKPNKYIDLQQENGTQFDLESLTTTIAEATITGQVITHELGTTTITATSKIFPSNKADVSINVVYPDKIEWDSEQWVKPSYLNKGEGSVGPFNPTLNNITFFYNGHEITIPNSLQITLEKTWETVGTHEINPTFKEINMTLHGIVHTCPPPKVSDGKLRVHVNSTNSEMIIECGSGHFHFEYDHSYIEIDGEHSKDKITEQSNGILYSKHKVSPIKEGTVMVKIIDDKFTEYQTTVQVEIHSHLDEPTPTSKPDTPNKEPVSPEKTNPNAQSTQKPPTQSTQNATAQSTQNVTAQSTPNPPTQSTQNAATQSTQNVTAQSTPNPPTQSTQKPSTQSTQEHAESTPAPENQNDESNKVRNDVLFICSSLVTFAMVMAAIFIL